LYTKLKTKPVKARECKNVIGNQPREKMEEYSVHINIALKSDYDFIVDRDKHVNKELVKRKIEDQEIYILQEADKKIGWMRFNYFWDNTPFLNMIWIDEEYRNKGKGKEVVLFWEDQMKQRGFELVMTSTLANEDAQHFYRRLGYRDSGCLLLENEPLEIILTKRI